MRPRATIFLASYGTLRPGGSLCSLVQKLHRSVNPSAITGVMYEHSGEKYPIADLSEGVSGYLVTTTYELPISGAVLEILDMEIKSGYVPVWMPELDRDSLAPTGRMVLAFDYGGAADQYGPKIESGNWLDWCSKGRTQWLKEVDEIIDDLERKANGQAETSAFSAEGSEPGEGSAADSGPSEGGGGGSGGDGARGTSFTPNVDPNA